MCATTCWISNPFLLRRSRCDAFSSSEQKEPESKVLASMCLNRRNFLCFSYDISPTLNHRIGQIFPTSNLIMTRYPVLRLSLQLCASTFLNRAAISWQRVKAAHHRSPARLSLISLAGPPTGPTTPPFCIREFRESLIWFCGYQYTCYSSTHHGCAPGVSFEGGYQQ